MSEVKTGEAARKPFLYTKRTDQWYWGPLSIFIGLMLFVCWVVFRFYENNYYEAGNLLSPFFSPKIPWPHCFDNWPTILKCPAIFILWVPCLFRATCYYFRRAYYRAFFLTPPACAVSGYKGFEYEGESKFPFFLQNFHRYMFYLAALSLVHVWIDFIQTLFTADHLFNFGFLQFSVGTIVFGIDAIWLSNYVLGCHAFRHLIGGRLDCFSCSEHAKTSLSFWKNVTHLNENHALWAWLSLLSVASADVYTRLVAIKAFGPVGDFVFFTTVR
jgi:hypothetical protein